MIASHDREFTVPPEKLPAGAGYPDYDPPTSALSVVSLVFGILAYTALPAVGAVVSIVTGHLALGQIREAAGRLGGGAMARAGLILGYLQVAIAAVAVVLIGLVLGFGLFAFDPFTGQERRPATAVEDRTPQPPEAVPGVKMVNEMDRADFRRIADAKLDIKDDEIIACYNAGGTGDDPEFALIAKSRLVYLKEGRTTSFDWDEVEAVKDDTEYTSITGQMNLNLYYIEVTSKSGPRIRITIRPRQEGHGFCDVLKATWKAAGK